MARMTVIGSKKCIRHCRKREGCSKFEIVNPPVYKSGVIKVLEDSRRCHDFERGRSAGGVGSADK